MYKLAEAWGMTPPRRNPALSIRRYKEYGRERFLSPEECRRLAEVLDEADGSVCPSAISRGSRRGAVPAQHSRAVPGGG